MAYQRRVPAGLRHRAAAAGFLTAIIICGLTCPLRAAVPAAGIGALPASSGIRPAAATAPEAANRPAGAMIISQIHNAPGWQPSHTYTEATGPATRVVSGPGWNPANRNYRPGEALDAYQLTSQGRCTSAPGDGPRGTGAAIADGTCTWKYLSVVDYISLTGWAFDNQPWKHGALYHYRDYVTSDSPLRAYTLTQERSCASSVAPTGTGDAKSMIVTEDGCYWQYQADIIYTSGRSHIPTETGENGRSALTLMLRGNYEAQLWNDREYVAGQNGETAPIRVQDHDDFRREGGVLLGCTTTPCYHLIVTTAPGESFRDHLTPSDPLAGYEPSKGVAIRNSLPFRYPYEPAGLDIHDNYVDLIDLQIKSIHGAAVNGMSSYANKLTVRNCILDGGSSDEWTSHATVTVDTSSVVANSLVISHAAMGIELKYPGFVLHTTVVSRDRIADSVGIVTFYKWSYDDTVVSNSAIFGFMHAVSHDEGGPVWSQQSSNNVTDAPVGDTGQGLWPGGPRGATSTVDHLPGTVYGAAMSRAFVRPGTDWRLSDSSPLRGAGSAFGAFPVNCETRRPQCAERVIYNFDTPDLIGTTRPQAGHVDIGAWQSCPSSEGGQGSRCSSTRQVGSARP